MNGKRPWPGRDAFAKGIFTALPEYEWKAAKDIVTPSIVDKKRLLFREGEAARHIYIVGGGLVKTYKSPSDDRIQIVNILGPGDVAGAESLTHSFYANSAAALARALVLKSDRQAFLDFIHQNPTLFDALLENLNLENAALQTQLARVGTKKALPRVASCLLLFMEKQVEPGQSRPFNLPISRQEMGAFLGLSPETVSRQLKDLSTSRVIKLEHRRLTVLDLGHLQSIAQV